MNATGNEGTAHSSGWLNLMWAPPGRGKAVIMKKAVVFGTVDQLNAAAIAWPDAVIVRDDAEMVAFQEGTMTRALVHGTEDGVLRRFPSIDEGLVYLVRA